MAFINRIKELKSNNLINHFKRSYFHLTTPPFTNQTTSSQRLLLSSNHNFLLNFPKIQSIFQCPDDYFSFKVRFFAAPVQAKRKVEVSKPVRSRINEEIKAHYLRLVTDEGHSVVSLKDALSQAKSLGLDLVEVDRNAKPPVCKIYDFHREKYQLQVRKKERAKLKAAGSLRRGSCKLVRISAKTELKDLQLKADSIKRLMERGYRVKCTIAGTEDQDLSGLMSQLTDLIEDIAFVDFGPKFEATQAHLVVRHIKFGKKGGNKASKINTSTTSDIHTATSTDVLEESDEESDSNIDEESEEDLTWSFTPISGGTHNFDKDNNAPNSTPKMPGFSGPSVKQETEFTPRMPVFSGPNVRRETESTPRMPGFSGPNVRQETESTPRMPGFSAPNVRQEAENRYAKSAGRNSLNLRNPVRYPDNGTSHPQPQPPPNSDGDLRSRSENFGIFSNPNRGRPSDGTRIPNPGSVPGPVPPKSDSQQKSESADKKFGIFSR